MLLLLDFCLLKFLLYESSHHYIYYTGGSVNFVANVTSLFL